MTAFSDFLMILGILAAWHLYSLANRKSMRQVFRDLGPGELQSAPRQEYIGPPQLPGER